MYLLTGSSGVLGTELQMGDMQYCATGSSWFDITDEDAMFNAYDYVYRDFERGILKGVVHCAAYTNVPGAEKNMKDAIETNIHGTKRVVDMCREFRVPLVYISTDYVYPGETGNYKETSMTRPVNFYAFTKLAGEAYFDYGKDLIIRTSFKPNKPWPHPKAFDDLYTSADYVDVIAPKIEFLIMNGASGIYNVGTERKTIYDLARRRTPGVLPMSKNEISDVHLPSDTSLNLSKYNQFFEDTTI